MPFYERQDNNRNARGYQTLANPPRQPSTPAPAQQDTALPQTQDSIWADPAFLAFQRSVNGSIGAGEASFALQGDAARRALDMQLAGVGDQVTKGIDRTGVVAGGQGNWSSSARTQDQANIQTTGNQQAGALQSNFADRQAELSADLSQRVYDMKQQAADRGLEYAQKRYTA